MRKLFLCLLTISLSSSYLLFFSIKEKLPLPINFSPLFQQTGKVVQSTNRIFTHLMPVNQMDEKKLGEEIKKYFKEHRYYRKASDIKIEQYLNSLVKELTKNSRKNFEYEIFLEYDSPNAYAMPGGVILMTKSLFELANSEAEIVAILAHEIGHIERGHLFDAVRLDLVRRKYNLPRLDSYTIDHLKSLVTSIFNKTQEDEADEFGYQLLLQNQYDPTSMSKIFNAFLQLHKSEPNLYRDFFSSHPYIELRVSKFKNRALRWLKSYPEIKVYVGRKNLEDLICRYHSYYGNEAIEAKKILSIEETK